MIRTVEPAVYMDTLGPSKNVPDYQDILILQVSLCTNGTLIKCAYFAGILSVHINRFHCTPVHGPQ